MRVNMLRLPSGYNSSQNSYKKAILLTLTLALTTLIILHYMSDNISTHQNISSPLYRSKPSVSPDDTIRMKGCNLFKGEWVPYPKGPYYTNESSCALEKTQNCLKFGRPDTEFLKWRWRPDDCELPLFDAAEFLEIVRGKSMAFVGDSLARNQVQSLGCLLRSVAQSVEKSYEDNPRSKRWFYSDYDFTLAYLSTTHLVEAKGVDATSDSPVELHLDEVDKAWSTQVHDFDCVIISGGHWFSRPLMYREKNEVVGCSMCRKENITDLTGYYGFRKAFRAAFRNLLDSKNFKGTIILRTITPPHFEPQEWHGRGNCVRTKPYTKEELKLDWEVMMYYLVQVEEFLAAKIEGKRRGLVFELLDVNEAMRPRADGHPNHFGQPPEMRSTALSDCLHWCLPGPIDLWNELLLQIMKTKGDGRIWTI
ncbi:hypothetical protein RHMOL_Rhmol10G0081600 [Rhododendron molle]|uniref:Uncharacterized protein n=1 Tax=Rhododendron molle TaxID=49168 RepID=A0ACC0M1V5_RHOML|nr:hypothetical protein RHMOL_Rhmol10G0081600 [Rhododendron molle]